MESGVALVGMCVVPFPLSVDVMWTWSVEALAGRWKLIVCAVGQYNLAVASSNDGLMEWSDLGFCTLNSISFLTSAFILVVGNAMVHLLFCECS